MKKAPFMTCYVRHVYMNGQLYRYNALHVMLRCAFWNATGGLVGESGRSMHVPLLFQLTRAWLHQLLGIRSVSLLLSGSYKSHVLTVIMPESLFYSPRPVAWRSS